MTQKEYQSALFIFRRDLRIDDNKGLKEALEKAEQVTPFFIFDPRQITDQNPYLSNPALAFMLESLADLEKQFNKINSKLHYGYGCAEDVVDILLTTKSYDALFLNQDYTPFSIMRDTKIKSLCTKHSVDYHAIHDLLLIGDPANVLTKSASAYKIFGPFFKSAYQKLKLSPLEKSIDMPPLQKKTSPDIPNSIQPPDNLIKKITKKNKSHIPGGTNAAKKILTNLNQQKNYAKTHNLPWIETTQLSPHNKFGTISIRYIAKTISDTLGRNHELIRQLFWRDFFSYLLFHNPTMLTHSARPKYEPKWKKNQELFARWCSGETGIPIIDAGMRQLNQTGTMHNRIRMLTASLLVKNLQIDWRMGARYFAQKLIDYDPAINAGNWQWISSTGYDAQPYFRVFNPWLQQKKFDPDCNYIKTWIPELKSFSPKDIHNPTTDYLNIYPQPIINTSKSAQRYIAQIKKH